MSLPSNFRFIIFNNTGQQLDFNSNSENEKAYIITTTSQRWGSKAITVEAKTDLANGDYEVLDSITVASLNSSFGIFHIETDNVSVSGDIILGIEHSPDGGETWPSDANNFSLTDMSEVITMTLSGAQQRRINIAL